MEERGYDGGKERGGGGGGRYGLDIWLFCQLLYEPVYLLAMIRYLAVL